MLIRLKDLTDLSARTTDGTRHDIRDLVVRRADLSATHVLVRLGAWLDRRDCAFRIRTMGTPDVDGRVWPTKVDEAQVRRAPVASGPGTTVDADTDVAAVAREGADLDPADLEDRTCRLSEAKAGDLVALSTLDEIDVFGADGETAGTVMDFLIDVEPGVRVSMVILHAGPTGREHQRVVPIQAVRDVAWGDDGPASLTLSEPAAKVSDAPQLHEMEREVKGTWLNKVMAYYGIG